MELKKSDLESFWNIIKKFFKNHPKKLEVIKLLLRRGFSIKPDQKIYCGEVEIPFKNIAEALGIDRRSVIGTVKKIYPEKEVFDKLECNEQNLIKYIQKIMSNILPAGIIFAGEESSILEITAKAKQSGIIAKVTELIAKQNVSIRQILATDPYLDPAPKLIIITNKKIPSYLISKILEVPGVETAKLIKL